MEDGRIIICKQCNGRGEVRVRFYYKDKHYYYFSKCGICYTKGYLDWVEYARGRKPGIAGFYIDDHPAGSCIIAPKKFGGCRVFDGHRYIDAKTERGEALWNYLVSEYK
ncbi:hypothetical protein KAR91_58005 [Candidatus Pacearchaeota archaeon]|nr:hypothetical protein [Candidatus Pacearchaeota archaeon]